MTEPYKVLLVEDSPSAALGIRKAVQSVADVEIVAVRNLADAEKMLGDSTMKFKAAIIDNDFPGGDPSSGHPGVPLIKKIRGGLYDAQDNQLSNMKILFQTATLTPELREQAVAAGADDCAEKSDRRKFVQFAVEHMPLQSRGAGGP